MHAESLNGDDPFLVKSLIREFRTKSSKATLDSQRDIRVECQHMAHLCIMQDGPVLRTLVWIQLAVRVQTGTRWNRDSADLGYRHY